MLYLAEYTKNKQSLLGFSVSKLALLAYYDRSFGWNILPQERVILVEKSCSFSDKTLVTVDIVDNKQVNTIDNEQVVGEIEPAKSYIVKILRDLAYLKNKQREQQQEIEEWKQSLKYQFEELERQKQEIEEWKQSLKYQFEELERQKKISEIQAQKSPEIKPQSISSGESNKNERDNLNSTNHIISSKKLLGEILKEANLISTAQLEIALKTQNTYSEIKIGKILTLKGWIEPKTVDFFIQHWDSLLEEREKYPTGFYFKQSGLLTENQVNIILMEQQKLKLKLGEIAVLKGWLNTKTVDYFLKNIYGNSRKRAKLSVAERGTYQLIDNTKVIPVVS